MSEIFILKELSTFKEKLRNTVKPYVKIKTQVVESATLWQSKFLGLPYLPKSMSLPQAANGEYMYLLAQINFSELPKLENFPNNGILQFFVSNTDFYGANIDELCLPNASPNQVLAQSNFRVVYHSNPDSNESNLVTDFETMPSPWNRDDSSMPFTVYSKYKEKQNSCFALSFEEAVAPISFSDYRFEEMIGIDPYNINANAEIEEYYEQFAGHHIGGYPLFTQTDPRSTLDLGEEPYELLLQIDSEATNKIDIIWGDVGICNFFIQPSKLAQLDFSSILYTWDCG